MASRDKFDVDMFHKSIQYALEKLGKSKSGFERTVVSKFKRKRRVGSGNELVDYSRAPCLGADQKARGLWERDCPGVPQSSSLCPSCAKEKSSGVENGFSPSFAVTWRLARLFVDSVFSPFAIERHLYEIH